MLSLGVGHAGMKKVKNTKYLLNLGKRKHPKSYIAELKRNGGGEITDPDKDLFILLYTLLPTALQHMKHLNNFLEVPLSRNLINLNKIRCRGVLPMMNAIIY